MRLFTLILLLAVATFTVYAADPEKKIVTPDTVAVYFASAYSTGDAKTMQSLSGTPFYIDGFVLTTEDRESLDELLAAMVEDTSELEPLEYTVKRTDDVASLDDKVFPEHVAFRLLVPEEWDFDDFNMNILIYVSTGDEPKVIGFIFEDDIENIEE
jgi:hypothetical protein